MFATFDPSSKSVTAILSTAPPLRFVFLLAWSDGNQPCLDASLSPSVRFCLRHNTNYPTRIESRCPLDHDRRPETASFVQQSPHSAELRRVDRVRLLLGEKANCTLQRTALCLSPVYASLCRKAVFRHNAKDTKTPLLRQSTLP